METNQSKAPYTKESTEAEKLEKPIQKIRTKPIQKIRTHKISQDCLQKPSVMGYTLKTCLELSDMLLKAFELSDMPKARTAVRVG